MADDIILSAAVRSNLLSLQQTATLLGKTQQRLATGLKVNSALDDPAAFFTAASLNARASDLNRLLDSVGLAVQTIEAADTGISAITDLVEAAQATVRQALQSPGPVTPAIPATVTGAGAAVVADAPAVDTGTADISALAATGGNLDINGTSIAIGAGDNAAAIQAAINALSGATGVSASLNGSNQLVLTSADPDTAVTIDATSDATTLTELGLTVGTTNPTNLLNGQTGGPAASETLSIDIGGTVTTITFGTGVGEVSTFAELTTALGSVTGGTASIDGSGNITVTATDDTHTITIGGTTTVGFFGLSAGATAPTVGATVNNANRTALEAQFNDLLVQIDFLAHDTGFNGVNLLQSDDLRVIFNEDASSSLTINGVDFDAAGLGITAASTTNFQLDAFLDNALLELDTAVRTLRTQASTFGSNLSVVEVRQDFTKELINVLETGATNLTIADSNEEGANLLSLQTRQQLSTVSLSLATEAEQNVLRLF